ncbi:MAG: DNA repair protein RecN [Desulfuromonadaceae bacterium]|nr:DNA repair protein RecN [Desulfuromonadaceae bacterium]
MLTELVITNVAIIDRLELSFGPGFNVLTGETGAGKSIIIDAVNLVMGGRANSDLIRSGCEEAVVEGIFDISSHRGIQNLVAGKGFDSGAELLLKRVLSRVGRNRIYINGSPARLQQLQEIGRELIVIYGQHEHQILQRSDRHLEQLDRFSGLESEEADYREAYRHLRDLAQALHAVEEKEKNRRDRLALLEFQCAEIAAAALTPGEDAELEAEKLRLQNAEKLLSVAEDGYQTLYDGERAVTGELDRVTSALESLQDVDPALGALSETVRNALYTLEDAAFQLRDYAARVVFDEERRRQVDERLQLLNGLKRRYAQTLEGVLEHAARADSEIGELKRQEAFSQELRKELAEWRQRLAQAGNRWSQKRHEALPEMKRAVEREMADLAMPKATFEIRLTPLAEPGPRGCEQGEFFLSVNPGEDPKPLAAVASGGELSRIMLALNRAAPEREAALSMIFDEVDAGIGGAAGAAVGKKLRQVSRLNQVLCITHLPQVAAFADIHYMVEKKSDGERTVVSARPLAGDERVAEMARMLGGARITQKTLDNAREMIFHAASPAGTA